MARLLLVDERQRKKRLRPLLQHKLGLFCGPGCWIRTYHAYLDCNANVLDLPRFRTFHYYYLPHAIHFVSTAEAHRRGPLQANWPKKLDSVKQTKNHFEWTTVLFNKPLKRLDSTINETRLLVRSCSQQLDFQSFDARLEFISINSQSNSAFASLA